MALIDDVSEQAAIALTALATGATPKARFPDLTAFAKQQYASYEAQGVGNPALGPFEALGKAFAADATTKGFFSAHYGYQTAGTFIDDAYTMIYGAVPASEAKASLLAQISYFTELYRGVGIASADAALQARGAVLGQLIGYAFTDASAAARTGLDEVVKSIVADAHALDYSRLGKALDGFALPPAGVAPVVLVPDSPIQDFTLDKAVAEIFVARPGFYGNQLTGFVVGQDKIDLTQFAFGPGIAKSASTAMGPDGQLFVVGGVHYAAVINSGGLYIDTDGNGDFKGTADVFVQLVGTQGNPSAVDLIFA